MEEDVILDFVSYLFSFDWFGGYVRCFVKDVIMQKMVDSVVSYVNGVIRQGFDELGVVLRQFGVQIVRVVVCLLGQLIECIFKSVLSFGEVCVEFFLNVFEDFLVLFIIIFFGSSVVVEVLLIKVGSNVFIFRMVENKFIWFCVFGGKFLIYQFFGDQIMSFGYVFVSELVVNYGVLVEIIFVGNFFGVGKLFCIFG